MAAEKVTEELWRNREGSDIIRLSSGEPYSRQPVIEQAIPKLDSMR